MTKLVLLISLLPFCSGCAGCSNKLKHMQSDLVGLHRTITLYGADGKEIRAWKTTAKVEDKGGTCYFLDGSGKAVIVSGVFVIEEN
jgi:hypothetical protein